MPNLIAAQPNIGGALCESSVIPFLVPRRKVWLRPAAEVPCSNTANIYDNGRLGCKVNFARSKIPPGGKSPQKCIYSVPAQETTKDRAKFDWPPMSDVVAVNEAKTRNRLKFAGKLISAVSGMKFAVL